MYAKVNINEPKNAVKLEKEYIRSTQTIYHLS